jgi:LacI family transcriptional regulator
MLPFRRTTLKDVAKVARLSLAAVSMALRDHPSLPAKTVARVKRIATKLNYAPDPALCALAAHRSRLQISRNFSVIGLVSNWSTHDGWSHAASAQQVIGGAQARAVSLGYTLQHIWAREGGASPERFNRILQSRGIRGVILAPFERPDDTFALEWKNYSVVTIERSLHYTRFHHIVPNHYADLLLCWQHVRAQGYSRVGLVVRKDLAVRWGHQWEAAHSYTQSSVAAKMDRIPTLELEGSDPVGQVRGWLRKYRPEVVINRSEALAAAAKAERLRIPDDLGYVSLNLVDDEVEGAAGIRQPREAMGALAVDVLNSLMQRNQRGFQSVSIGTHVDGEWEEGRTLLRRRGLASAAGTRRPVRKSAERRDSI